MPPAFQSIYEVYAHQKADLLLHLLSHQDDWKSTIVFLRNRDELHFLTTELKHSGIRAESISGSKKPELRERALQELKNGSTHVLLATEAVLRDTDLSEVERIIQYDFPELDRDYLDRVEKCSVEVTTFVTQNDRKNLDRLEELAGISLERKQAAQFSYDDQPRKLKAAHRKGQGANKTGSKPLQHKKPKLKNKGPRRKTGRTRKR
ncbi:MAG: helicase-related protein [Akkermansiaceae bacterium]